MCIRVGTVETVKVACFLFTVVAIVMILVVHGCNCFQEERS